MTAIERRRTYFFRAYSDPRQKKYQTMRCKDGKVFCTCPGFMFRRTCRHVVRAKSWK